MAVIRIVDSSDLQRRLGALEEKKLCVIEFIGKKCAPCDKIAPFFNQLSTTTPSATFLQVDVGECPAVAARYSIRATPTFIFFKGGKELERVEAANPTVVEDIVKGYVNKVNIFAGSGRRLGGGGAGPAAARPGAAGRLVNLDGGDNGQPQTKIQLVWPDRTKQQLTLNATDSVGRIRNFICASKPDFAFTPFSLYATHPDRKLGQEAATIQQARLERATILIKVD